MALERATYRARFEQGSCAEALSSGGRACDRALVRVAGCGERDAMRALAGRLTEAERQQEPDDLCAMDMLLADLETRIAASDAWLPHARSQLVDQWIALTRRSLASEPSALRRTELAAVLSFREEHQPALVLALQGLAASEVQDRAVLEAVRDVAVVELTGR